MVVMHDINETLEVTGDLGVDMVHLKTGTITEIDQYFSSAAVQMAADHAPTRPHPPCWAEGGGGAMEGGGGAMGGAKSQGW